MGISNLESPIRISFQFFQKRLLLLLSENLRSRPIFCHNSQLVIDNTIKKVLFKLLIRANNLNPINMIFQAVIFVNFNHGVFHISMNHCIFKFPGGLLVIILELLDESSTESGTGVLQLTNGIELAPKNFVLVYSASILDNVERLARH